MNLESKIEGLLFWKGESLSRKKIASIFGVEAETLNQAIEILGAKLADRGVVLLLNGDEVMLGTHPDLSETIDKLKKEELDKELSKASLETLSIILYKNGASRSEIDYIRGVNSTFTLRALSIRGLIEKIPDAKDSRKYIYKPTFDLLAFMGVKSVEEMPEYSEIVNKINSTIDELGEQKSS